MTDDNIRFQRLEVRMNAVEENLGRVLTLAEDQVRELKAIHTTIQDIRKRDANQDADLERVKQVCHDFLQRKSNRIMAVSGGAGVSGAVLVEVALEIWRHIP
jgi:hypothetical protein